MPPAPLGRGFFQYAQAVNKLGWHWWPSDISIATTRRKGRAKCINLGHCTGLCTGAKASVDITCAPARTPCPGVELRTPLPRREDLQ
ncbi:MAG: hypothetical protein R3D67_11675 [Hyphomicrobiaceae bacterium]